MRNHAGELFAGLTEEGITFSDLSLYASGATPDPGGLVVEHSSGRKVRLLGVPGAEEAAAEAFVEAWDFDDETTPLRRRAKDAVNAPDWVSELIRAVVDTTLDEINILRAFVVGEATVSVNPPNLTNGSGFTKADITVTGAAFGDVVDVAAPYSLQGLIVTGYVHAADTVGVRIQNATGGAVDLAAGNWRIIVRRPEALSPRTLAQAKTAILNRIDSGLVD